MTSGQDVNTALMSSQQLKLVAGDGAHQHSTADREGARIGKELARPHFFLRTCRQLTAVGGMESALLRWHSQWLVAPIPVNNLD